MIQEREEPLDVRDRCRSENANALRYLKEPANLVAGDVSHRHDHPCTRDTDDVLNVSVRARLCRVQRNGDPTAALALRLAVYDLGNREIHADSRSLSKQFRCTCAAPRPVAHPALRGSMRSV